MYMYVCMYTYIYMYIYIYVPCICIGMMLCLTSSRGVGHFSGMKQTNQGKKIMRLSPGQAIQCHTVSTNSVCKALSSNHLQPDSNLGLSQN